MRMAKIEINWKKVIIEVIKAILAALTGAGATFFTMS